MDHQPSFDQVPLKSLDGRTATDGDRFRSTLSGLSWYCGSNVALLSDRSLVGLPLRAVRPSRGR